MTQSATQSRVQSKRLAFAAIAAVLLAIIGITGALYYLNFDPYIEKVLSLDRNLERGREIFAINCAGCHGIYGTGYVGPSLEHLSDRKSDTAIVRQVIEGDTPPMPKFQPTPQDMADLLEYLKRF